jgi:hypothetical protein
LTLPTYPKLQLTVRLMLFRLNLNCSILLLLTTAIGNTLPDTSSGNRCEDVLGLSNDKNMYEHIPVKRISLAEICSDPSRKREDDKVDEKFISDWKQSQSQSVLAESNRQEGRYNRTMHCDRTSTNVRGPGSQGVENEEEVEEDNKSFRVKRVSMYDTTKPWKGKGESNGMYSDRMPDRRNSANRSAGGFDRNRLGPAVAPARSFDRSRLGVRASDIDQER